MKSLLRLVVLVAAVGLVGSAGRGQHVSVTETPAPAWTRIGEVGVGQLCVDPTDNLLMVVDPPLLSSDPNHAPYGVREQPRRVYLRTSHHVPGYGTFHVDNPGPVHAVNLRDGTLWLVKRTEPVRPVARWSLTVSLPERSE